MALRTPAPMPRSVRSEAGQAVGHEQSIGSKHRIGQALVRQEAPGRPVPVTRRPQSQTQRRLRTRSAEANAESSQVKPQPRVWEEQGTPSRSRRQERSATENREVQSSRSRRTAARGAAPAQQGSHPLVKPVAPVQAAKRAASRNRRLRRRNGSRIRIRPRPAGDAPPKKGH